MKSVAGCQYIMGAEARLTRTGNWSLFVFLLALHILLHLGNCAAMVVGAGVQGFDGIAKQEFVLFGFGSVGIGGIFQGAEFGLEFGIRFDDELQQLANVVLAAYIHFDVIVKF